jgi:hypothetical protein
MRKIFLSNSFIIAAGIFLLSSCKKDQEIPDGIDRTLPSAQLFASEKLQIPEAVAVPANLPAGNIRVATFFAEGVQKYKSVAKAGSPGVFEWAFTAPEAALFDISDIQIGTHGAGPFWQISSGDSIFAQQFSPVRSAPSPDFKSIDWLLLKPKAGTMPTGLFTDVAYIQRIATVGGKAPSTPPVTADETTKVKYTAVYRFTKIKL